MSRPIVHTWYICFLAVAVALSGFALAFALWVRAGEDHRCEAAGGHPTNRRICVSPDGRVIEP